MIPENPIYQLSNIRYYYGEKLVLDIQSLFLAKGSITGLTGPNGSGKTTLLKLMAFIMKPGSGDILYNGKRQVAFSPGIRSKVTLLTQKPYLLKRTVFDNIIYGLKIRKDMKDIEQRVSNALAAVGLDYDNFARRMWYELSGGEAQRVAMAARLILKPEILLLDEPVASVDMESARLIRAASLKARKDWGTTLVIASHDLEWLSSVSDRQVSILKGKIFAAGSENIIPGPFESLTDDMVIRRLGNDQKIILNQPDQDAKTAVIRKKKTSLGLEKLPETDGLNQVWGQIISMNLEKKRNRILIKIAIEDLEFKLRFPLERIDRLCLCPGKNVVISFNSRDVNWI